ncbi:hypothetical protein ACTMU2_18325 [Cupriavidus basilensis]
MRIFAKDGTTWIICPALGGSAGLISQVQLDAFGKLLGTRLTASDFKHCPDLDPVDNAPEGAAGGLARSVPEEPAACRRSWLPYGGTSFIATRGGGFPWHTPILSEGFTSPA